MEVAVIKAAVDVTQLMQKLQQQKTIQIQQQDVFKRISERIHAGSKADIPGRGARINAKA